MKPFVAAIALVIAAPAAAQSGPAPQQDHAQHGQGPAGHGQHRPGEHEERDCCADRNNNGRMDCCEEAQRAPAPSEHANH